MRSQRALGLPSGYLIEKSLSLDNIFVVLLIFTYFRVPAIYPHKVLPKHCPSWQSVRRRSTLSREVEEGSAGKGAKAWCERGDSNPHPLRDQILSLARLPIPPLSRRPIIRQLSPHSQGEGCARRLGILSVGFTHGY